MRTVRHLEGSWRSHVTTRLITLLSTAMLKTKAFVLVECSPDSEGLRLTGVITRTVYMGKSLDSDRNTHCIPRSKRYRMLQTTMAGVVYTALPAKLAEPSSPSRAVAKCFRGEFFVPASSPQRHLPIESHSFFSAIDYQWA